MMVGRPARQHPSIGTAQTSRHATIEAKGNDVVRTVCGLARPDILEAGKLDGPDRVVVADNGRRTVEDICDVHQLPPVQELACLLYTSPSPRDGLLSRMPSSA